MWGAAGWVVSARSSSGWQRSRWAEHALALVAAAPDGDVLLTDADLSGPTAIAVGSESRGLPAHLAGTRQYTAAHPDVRARRLAQRRHVRGHPRLRGGAAAHARPGVGHGDLLPPGRRVAYLLTPTVTLAVAGPDVALPAYRAV